MKALIIDDTRLARQELVFLLTDQEDIEIVGEAQNSEEAELLIKQFQPDLLFLDIQMPGRTGFDLLESLDEVPHVIFTTAYSEYAMKAFEVNALDYLKKPIIKERLKTALDKVRERMSEKNEDRKMLTANSQVFVKDGERCWFVALKDVRILEIWDNYTRIYFQDEKPMIPRTLNYMESRLDPETFFRANRQQIVNLTWIERIEPWFSGSIRLFLKDGSEVEVSRRQTAKFKQLMSF